MTFTVTAAQLRAIAASKAPNADAIAAAFNASAAQFGLDQPDRAAHFFAQLAHESGGFRFVREIWGPTAAQLRYEGRKDLGNTQPGDGKRFLGRGLIQVTGRANARAFTAWAQKEFPGAPDFEAQPELMEQFPWALVSAFWFWTTHDLNALADKDPAGDLTAITKRINGGTNGLADRRVKFAVARKVFEAGFALAPPTLATKNEDGRKTLRRGAKGDDVKELQQKLADDLKKNPRDEIGEIIVNGSFGPLTEAAVIDFQRAHDLLPDGIVGPATWHALDA